jgi:hypothetical protein
MTVRTNVTATHPRNSFLHMKITRLGDNTRHRNECTQAVVAKGSGDNYTF